MAESWCKVASDLDSHPKIRRAGRLGREVYLFVLRRNAMPGNPDPGRIASIELEPWYLADQLMMSEAEAITGVTACVTASLLVNEGETFAIVGWSDEWGRRPMSNAERQKKFRDKHKKPQANHEPSKPTVTDRNDAIVTGNASNAGEERRGEEIKDLSRPPARAIPPNTAPSTAYDPEVARDRGRLAESMWAEISDARVRVAAELGLSAHPFTKIHPGAHPRGFRDLQQRISEEGRDAPSVCSRVLEALISQARAKRSIEWLSEKAFTEGGWITAKEQIPGWLSVPRATQKSSTRDVFGALDELAEQLKGAAS